MQKLNSAVVITGLMVLATANVASAESWICEHNNLVREINVESEGRASAPCAVVYNKDSEGVESRVLWTAKTDGSYCEEKANGLAEKLKGHGWECTAF